jgi:hypothetical protein
MPQKHTSPNPSDPSTPTTTRPMHHPNGPIHRPDQYLNRPLDDFHHKTNNDHARPIYILGTPQHLPATTTQMSSAEDPNNNPNAAASRGRRGGSRAYRGRTRGRGFHFNPSA